MRRCSWVVLLTAVVAVAGCATGTTVSSPVPTATPVTSVPTATASGRAGESREVHGFTGVELAAFGDLQIDQTGTESLTIEAAPDVLPKLTSGVSGGVLRLRLAPGTTIRTTTPVVYHLTVATSTRSPSPVQATSRPRTSGPTASPSTSAVRVASPWPAPSTRRSSPSAAPGTTTARTCRVPPQRSPWTGPPKAVVRVSTRLNATVDGVGSVQYIGNPQVTRKINGVGSVKQR